MILDLEDLPIKEREKTEELQKSLAMMKADSACLAAHVVLYKTLGLFKNSAILCMSELQRRRSLGEDFDFENFIDDEVNKLPKAQPIDFTTIKGLVNLQQIYSFISKGST